MNKRVTEIYTQIEDLNQELEQIRESCPHTEKEEGNYSWRPGCIHRAWFCMSCGKFLKYVDDPYGMKGAITTASVV